MVDKRDAEMAARIGDQHESRNTAWKQQWSRTGVLSTVGVGRLERISSLHWVRLPGARAHNVKCVHPGVCE
jgi:hypothetical protein